MRSDSFCNLDKSNSNSRIIPLVELALSMYRQAWPVAPPPWATPIIFLVALFCKQWRKTVLLCGFTQGRFSTFLTQSRCDNPFSFDEKYTTRTNWNQPHQPRPIYKGLSIRTLALLYHAGGRRHDQRMAKRIMALSLYIDSACGGFYSSSQSVFWRFYADIEPPSSPTHQPPNTLTGPVVEDTH
jgi:hypothetical protein